jgi:hypothetical protein
MIFGEDYKLWSSSLSNLLERSADFSHSFLKALSYLFSNHLSSPSEVWETHLHTYKMADEIIVLFIIIKINYNFNMNISPPNHDSGTTRFN